jgi:hypothetical protein
MPVKMRNLVWIVDINYYKVEEEFQNFLKGFGIAD